MKSIPQRRRHHNGFGRREVWAAADLIIKVKEPQASEFRFSAPQSDSLHLSSLWPRKRQLTLAMLESGVTGIAYETVEDSAGRAPAFGADE